jgi:uncharacterized membrane protein
MISKSTITVALEAMVIFDYNTVYFLAFTGSPTYTFRILLLPASPT